MIMNNLENVVVVRYANRTFIPISKTEIAEEVKIWDNETSLLLQRQAKITSARGPYGGNTITIKHIAPFLRVSYDKYFNKDIVIAEIQNKLKNLLI